MISNYVEEVQLDVAFFRPWMFSGGWVGGVG